MVDATAGYNIVGREVEQDTFDIACVESVKIEAISRIGNDGTPVWDASLFYDYQGDYWEFRVYSPGHGSYLEAVMRVIELCGAKIKQVKEESVK